MRMREEVRSRCANAQVRGGGGEAEEEQRRGGGGRSGYRVSMQRTDSIVHSWPVSWVQTWPLSWVWVPNCQTEAGLGADLRVPFPGPLGTRHF